MDQFVDRIHSELLDDFLEIIDNIFAVRIPPLFTVLRHYSILRIQERKAKEPEKYADTTTEAESPVENKEYIADAYKEILEDQAIDIDLNTDMG